MQHHYLNNEQIKTIYFGGGTPSLLSVTEIKHLLDVIYHSFNVALNQEITLEANPDDLTLEKLTQLREAGINRLSIGIQSFDDTILKFLNRTHDGKSGYSCVENARIAGFENISIDLIYAIPGQDNNALLRNIERAVAVQPQHISSYSLTVEEKTVFGRWSSQGKLKLVNDETAAEQLEILMDELGLAGFEQYEVSNFGQPGYHSHHNSSYWRGDKYLGIGPSAHSYNVISRQHNIKNNYTYLQSIVGGRIPFELEMLSREDQINEYLLTTLRTQWGCDLERLRKDFNYDLDQGQAVYLKDLQERSLATIENSVLILTKKGKLLADKIASDLFCYMK